MNYGIGILGAGRMGSAMIKELVRSNPDFLDRLIATNHKKDNLFRLNTIGIKKTLDNLEAVNSSKILVLSVRPQQMKELINEIKNGIRPDHILISIAIGVPLKWFSQTIPNNHNIFMFIHHPL